MSHPLGEIDNVPSSVPSEEGRHEGVSARLWLRDTGSIPSAQNGQSEATMSGTK